MMKINSMLHHRRVKLIAICELCLIITCICSTINNDAKIVTPSTFSSNMYNINATHKSEPIIDTNTTEIICNILARIEEFIREKEKMDEKCICRDIVELVDRPFVTLSYAQTLNGIIAKRLTSSQTSSNLVISSPQAFKLTHALRSIHDAILVGKNTMSFDNPRLNVRLWRNQSNFSKSKQPRPVVLDSNLTWLLREWKKKDMNVRVDDENENSNSYFSHIRANNLIVCCSKDAFIYFKSEVDQNMIVKYENDERNPCYDENDKLTFKENDKQITLLSCNTQNDKEDTNNVDCNQLCLKHVLHQIYNKCRVRSIMVEGGSSILSSFASIPNYVDCVCVTIAPHIISSEFGLNAFKNIRQSVCPSGRSINVRSPEYWRLGTDCILLCQWS